MISENEKDKRAVFSEWEDCDCNLCGHYWTSACDGAKKGAKKPCNQFLATRSVVIPEQIAYLNTKVNVLSIILMIVMVVNILHILFGG